MVPGVQPSLQSAGEVEPGFTVVSVPGHDVQETEPAFPWKVPRGQSRQDLLPVESW